MKTFFVGSGKGGVGKSTITINLAAALAKQGVQVGVLDADVYGPSIPIMLGLRRMPPRVVQNENGEDRILPFTKFGIKAVSIGFFMEEARSLVWRGPMIHGILKKMIDEVEWGSLDILLIDLPPGTGDVPISLSQLIKVGGAIIVCTPQEVAVLDAVKAINSFGHLEIPLVGVIENMAGFRVPGSEEVYEIFGSGKARELAERFNIPLLGSVPLISAIRRGGDEGVPAACHLGDQNAGESFGEISRSFLRHIRNTAQLLTSNE